MQIIPEPQNQKNYLYKQQKIFRISFLLKNMFPAQVIYISFTYQSNEHSKNLNYNFTYTIEKKRVEMYFKN